MTQTIITRSGKTVESNLTNDQAKEICRTIRNSDFAQSISSAPNPTDEQVKWMHVLAMKEVKRNERNTPQETINIGNCAGIGQIEGRGPRIAYECDSAETAREYLKVAHVRATPEGYEECTADGEFMTGSKYA